MLGFTNKEISSLLAHLAWTLQQLFMKLKELDRHSGNGLFMKSEMATSVIE